MIVTRFAVSPAGALHVGAARLAIVNALIARRAGGRFLLRLDDADAARGNTAAEAIRTDLEWLGLHWDETLRQSERLALYEEAAETLKRSGRLYPCFESEEELAVKHDLRLRRGQAPVYDRAMLKLTAAQRAAAEAGGKRPHWRFLLSDQDMSWSDLVLGRRRVKLPTLSDPIVIRADGTPHGLLTSVVDDLAHHVSHLVRAEDQIAGTAMQMDLMAALGANPGAIGFAHLPALTNIQGSKLSRRFGGATLRNLRHDGIEPKALFSYLARLGSSAPQEPLDPDALAAAFDLQRFSPAPPRFDINDLLALNRLVLQDTSFADIAPRLPAGATESFWHAVRGSLDLLIESRGYWDVVAGTIVPPVIEGEGAFLRTALEELPAEPWNDEVFPRWTSAIRAQTGREGDALTLPLRLALTGEEQGPDLESLLPLIGRARAAQRLQIAAN